MQTTRGRARTSPATLEAAGLLRRRSVPALRATAPRGAARVERGARLLGGGQARRRGRDLARSGAVLLGQGDPHVRDRRGVPEPADDDAHRPARAHALPQARAAGIRAVAHARARDAGARPRRRARRARRRRARRSTRSRRSRCRSRCGSSPSCSASRSRTGTASTSGRRRRSRARPTGRPRSASACRPRCTSTCSRPRRDGATTRATTSSRCSRSAEVDGESLNDDELVMFLNQLLVAGNETTRHAISGGIAALAERPDQWQRLVADRVARSTPRPRRSCAGPLR